MPDHFDLPPELAALMEKRLQEEDRRKQDQGVQAAGQETAEGKERRLSEERRKI